MLAWVEVEAQYSFTEHDDIDIDRFHKVRGFPILDKRPETHKVVRVEELDLLAGLLDTDILGRQRVNRECLHEHAQFLGVGVEAIEPPNTLATPEKVMEVLAVAEKVADFRSMDCRIHFRGEEAEAIRVAHSLIARPWCQKIDLLTNNRTHIVILGHLNRDVCVGGRQFGFETLKVSLRLQGGTAAHLSPLGLGPPSVLVSHKFIHFLKINTTPDPGLFRWGEADILLRFL